MTVLSFGPTGNSKEFLCLGISKALLNKIWEF